MTLTELRYVVAVARERHFGRAAEACFVSQPTLSVAVRKLESELGVALFERSPSDVTVTEIGKQIVAQAQRILEESAALKQMAHQQKDQLQGPIRIGLIHTVVPYILPQIVPVLRERAPKMPLIIEEDYRAELGERLKQGELDVIFVTMPFEQPGVITETVYEEPLVLIMSKDNPLANKPHIVTADLSAENVLLLGPGHCLREQVLSCCPNIRSRSSVGGPYSNVQATSLDAIRNMVASGVGVSIVPESAADPSLPVSSLISVREFSDVRPSRFIALASRKRFPRPMAVQMLRDVIQISPQTTSQMVRSIR